MLNKIKKTLLSKEMIMFLFGGVSAFLLDFGLLSFQVYVLKFETEVLGLIFIPNIISTTIAIIYNFFIQKYLAFDSKENSRFKNELVIFAGVQIFNILFFGGLIFGAFLFFTRGLLLAKLLTTVFQMISSFFLYKFVVFKKYS